jgi:hypothetical protein
MCDLFGFLAPLVQDRVELLIRDLAHALLNRAQKLDRHFCQITFQLRVTLACKVIFNFLLRLASDEVIDLA